MSEVEDRWDPIAAEVVKDAERIALDAYEAEVRQRYAQWVEYVAAVELSDDA